MYTKKLLKSSETYSVSVHVILLVENAMIFRYQDVPKLAVWKLCFKDTVIFVIGDKVTKKPMLGNSESMKNKFDFSLFICTSITNASKL